MGVRPDFFADFIGLPEAERQKWEAVLEKGQHFDTRALKEMTRA